MAAATRVVLVPPRAWDEERLLAATRKLPTPAGAVWPGDALGDLIVVGVDPEPGAVASEASALEILPEPRARAGTTLDVAILLDAGASMAQPWSAQHTRWSAAREALGRFLAAPRTRLRHVTLFIYARTPQLIAGPIASANLTLPELKPGGRSMTGSALNAALASLAQNAAPDTPQTVLILSDGAGEPLELERAAARALRLGVTVHVILFSPGADDAFAKLASATGGSVQQATAPPSFELRYEPAPLHKE